MKHDFLTFYILDEQGNPVPEHDSKKWATWFEESMGTDIRTVGSTYFGSIHVSTVFLSLPHASREPGNDNVMLYETMIFASDAVITRLRELSETDDRSIFSLFFGGDDIQKRYATKQEAIQGHKTMCTFVEVCLTKGLLDGVLDKQDEE